MVDRAWSNLRHRAMSVQCFTLITLPSAYFSCTCLYIFTCILQKLDYGNLGYFFAHKLVHIWFLRIKFTRTDWKNYLNWKINGCKDSTRELYSNLLENERQAGGNGITSKVGACVIPIAEEYELQYVSQLCVRHILFHNSEITASIFKIQSVLQT